MFKNITVAVDGSDHAWNALGIACDLATQYDGAIHLVHTPELESTGIAVGSGAVEIKPTAAQIAEGGRAVMEQATAQARAAGIDPASQTIGSDTAAADVTKTAETTQSDLIVMGRRGLGRVTGLVMGSTSQKIAQSAPCAVLTAK